MLAEYTWQQQETISVKGKVQSQRLFEAQLGPDGRIRRTAMDLPEGNLSQTEKAGGMHEWITQKKQRGALMYAQELKEVAETYAQVDPESLRRAYERGDVTNGQNPAGNGVKKLSIHNYVKALHQRFEVSSRGELLAKAGATTKSDFTPKLSITLPRQDKTPSRKE